MDRRAFKTNFYSYWHSFVPPFVFDHTVNFELQVNDLNYWLLLWIKFYNYIKNNLTSQSILVNYDLFCDNTEAVWRDICEILDLRVGIQSNLFIKSTHSVKELLLPDLLNQANELYDELIAECRTLQSNRKLC